MFSTRKMNSVCKLNFEPAGSSLKGSEGQFMALVCNLITYV